MTRRHNETLRAYADVHLAMSNLYWRSRYISATYRREGDRPPYASDRVRSAGQHVPWESDWGTLPGTLFMFGGMEGTVNPYNSRPGPRVSFYVASESQGGRLL